MSGVGPAADSNGYVIFRPPTGPLTRNTGGADYGDTVLKLTLNKPNVLCVGLFHALQPGQNEIG